MFLIFLLIYYMLVKELKFVIVLWPSFPHIMHFRFFLLGRQLAMGIWSIEYTNWIKFLLQRLIFLLLMRCSNCIVGWVIQYQANDLGKHHKSSYPSRVNKHSCSPFSLVIFIVLFFASWIDNLLVSIIVNWSVFWKNLNYIFLSHLIWMVLSVNGKIFMCLSFCLGLDS